MCSMKSLKRPDNPGAIILGGHVQAYGIVRVFGENSIPCIVIDKTRYNIARHSRYCSAFYEVGLDELLDYLMELGRNGRYNGWLIMPTDDYHVRLLSRNRKELSKHFLVTVDDWDRISLFFNKKSSYPLAREAGVPVPRTYYPDSRNDLRRVEAEVDIPCIIKPSVMLDFYRYYKKKVIVCKNQYDLIANFDKATRHICPTDLMIQEIIPGSSENQYSVGMLYDRDRSCNHLIVRRKRQHPVDFGNATTYAETVDIPELKEYAHKILSSAGFFGLCEVEFKYDGRDGQYKFLEVNPRTWKWHLISQPAGVPFLTSLYSYLTEGTHITSNDYQKAAWRDMVTDIPVILDMMRKGLYVTGDRRKTVSAVANPKDIKPFLYQLLYLPYLFFNR